MKGGVGRKTGSKITTKWSLCERSKKAGKQKAGKQLAVGREGKERIKAKGQRLKAKG